MTLSRSQQSTGLVSCPIFIFLYLSSDFYVREANVPTSMNHHNRTEQSMLNYSFSRLQSHAKFHGRSKCHIAYVAFKQETQNAKQAASRCSTKNRTQVYNESSVDCNVRSSLHVCSVRRSTPFVLVKRFRVPVRFCPVPTVRHD
jgi:hypothetical protein